MDNLGLNEFPVIAMPQAVLIRADPWPKTNSLDWSAVLHLLPLPHKMCTH
jgi:hypothetical protein